MRDEMSAISVCMCIIPKAYPGIHSLIHPTHHPSLPPHSTNIAATWLFTAFAVGLLWLEYRSYIALRFKWLTLPRTHNYSVMVSVRREQDRDHRGGAAGWMEMIPFFRAQSINHLSHQHTYIFR